MNIWKRLTHFFEYGDLTPLAVIISVAHYGPVLEAHGEYWLVAWIVGAIIDLLHFRSVRRLFQANGRQSIVGHALIAIVTTITAVGYHLRFYDGDLLLALPIPIGIAILAQHAAGRELVETNMLQERAKEVQREANEWQNKYNEAQTAIKELQTHNKRQRTIIKAWESLNTEAQTLAQFNAKQITAKQAAEAIGVKDVRTVRSRAEKLNGIAK